VKLFGFFVDLIFEFELDGLEIYGVGDFFVIVRGSISELIDW
jgi:hypothetical protein